MPITTYRLQLHSGFTFADATALAPYLAALGVSDCYTSPLSTAMPGSTHGYDVCRHTEVNPELGGDAGLRALVGELTRLELGLLVDFVPNHMSNDPRTNEWWRDVLENGPSSPFARFFDIDWDPVKTELKDKLLLPILGEPYGEALERGLLSLRFDQGALVLDYGDLTVPINPRRSPLVLEHGLDALRQELGEENVLLREFLSVLTALRNLPPYTERDSQRIAERHRERQVARDRLQRLVDESEPIRSHIDRAVAAFTGTPGQPASFDRLHELLELQAYRLASWRTAADEINYRRFFDVNQLAGLRVEDPVVFDDIHRLLLDLVHTGVVTGVRLDHIDGLFDPRAYLAQLADAVGGVYLVVEKILSSGEALRADWPIAGTTGYGFLNDVNGVFIDGRQARILSRGYSTFTEQMLTFADVAYESKRLIVSTALSSEFQVLAQAVNRLSERSRLYRDFTLASIQRALREIVACFPVYRTYVSPSGVTAADEAVVDAAIAEARRRNPAQESSIFDFLRTVLLPPDAAGDFFVAASDEVDRTRFDVAMRFQQYTAPVQAKGIEDTAFYRYHLLSSLNEVGGNPGQFGRSVAEFHAANIERRRLWPREMLATTTHDTKRSEDVRARINVLSEVAGAWHRAVSRWGRLNASGRSRIGETDAPDRNDEYLFYQTLVGVWPSVPLPTPLAQAPDDLVARVTAYMQKAIREAKVHTSWITQNREYEAAVQRFVERTLTGPEAPAFLESFVAFLAGVAPAGATNSLAQLVLKIASPGVADFYQGTEFWDLSLVDPDNRRPVDWALRRRVLESLEPWLALGSVDAPRSDRLPDLARYAGELLGTWPDGRIKCFVTACGMRLRRRRSALFVDGSYEPLEVVGTHAAHVVAFGRQLGTDLVVAIVPRLTKTLCADAMPFPLGASVWGDTEVVVPRPYADRGFLDLLTGIRIDPSARGGGPTADAARWPVSRVLQSLPVSLLWAEPTPSTQ